MKILVTGAQGNLGTHLINHGKGKHQFVTLERNDWDNLDKIDLKNIDVVIHLAYDLKSKLTVDPDKIIDSNVLVTGKLLKLVKKHNIPKILFISTCAVYGSKSDTREDSIYFPESINGIMKLLNEKMILDFCKDTNIDVKILRVFNMYGGEDHFSFVNYLLRAARTGNELTLNNDGVSRRDFIHVEDVSQIIFKILESNNKFNVINVGTGKSVSIAELLEFATKIKKINLVKSNVPEIEYSRANISRLKSCFDYKFIDIFDYLKDELKL